MRLIDADELARSHCVECTYYHTGKCLGKECDWDSIGHIRDAKTIDAVSVVRCKDCIYCGVFNMCTYNGRMELMGENDYCSRGENETH